MTNNYCYKIEDVDVSKITYSEVKVNKYGGKSVYLNYVNRKPLRIQLPKLYLPFGVNDWEGKKSVDFSMRDNEQIVDFITKMEEKLITDSSELNWFKKKMPIEVVREFFVSTLKSSENYPPRLKCKMFNTDIFDSVKNENGEYPQLEVTNENIGEIISKGSSAQSIIECSGIWLVDKKFGISWKIIQMKIFKESTKLKGCCINDGDIDEIMEKTSDLSVSKEEVETSETDEIGETGENELENINEVVLEEPEENLEQESETITVDISSAKKSTGKKVSASKK